MTQAEIEAFKEAQAAWNKVQGQLWNHKLKQQFENKILKYALLAQITIFEAKDAVKKGEPVE